MGDLRPAAAGYGVHQVDLAGIFDEKLQRNKEQFGVTETYNTTREQIPLIPTTSSSRPSACRPPRPRLSPPPRRALRC